MSFFLDTAHDDDVDDDEVDDNDDNGIHHTSYITPLGRFLKLGISTDKKKTARSAEKGVRWKYLVESCPYACGSVNYWHPIFLHCGVIDLCKSYSTGGSRDIDILPISQILAEDTHHYTPEPFKRTSLTTHAPQAVVI